MSDPIAELADEMLQRLFPLCRSVTGEPVRETFRILNDYALFDVTEVPSRTQAFDWIVPDEWAITDAFITDLSGRRIIDFRENNLHVCGYSKPVDAEMSFAELRPHLFTRPDHPDWIPHRTGTYADSWGFALSQRQLETLDPTARYRVCIDSRFFSGSLSLADAVLTGRSEREYLITSYCCHPSMANDNISGLVMSVLLYRYLARRPNRRHGYRFVIAPETIGALCYLALNQQIMQASAGGFVLTCVGGPGPFGYKETFKGNDDLDRVVRLAFRDLGLDYIAYPFAPDGSDERQFASPGFRIPTGTITKDKYYEYDQYHTSADNLDLVTGKQIAETYSIYVTALEMLERNRSYRSLNPYGEPQLGRRGLYTLHGAGYKLKLQGQAERSVDHTDLIAWIMFMADGSHDLIAIAERSGLPLLALADMAEILVDHQLLEA